MTYDVAYNIKISLKSGSKLQIFLLPGHNLVIMLCSICYASYIFRHFKKMHLDCKKFFKLFLIVLSSEYLNDESFEYLWKKGLRPPPDQPIESTLLLDIFYILSEFITNSLRF